jgi:hypothetical protein
LGSQTKRHKLYQEKRGSRLMKKDGQQMRRPRKLDGHSEYSVRYDFASIPGLPARVAGVSRGTMKISMNRITQRKYRNAKFYLQVNGGASASEGTVRAFAIYCKVQLPPQNI